MAEAAPAPGAFLDVVGGIIAAVASDKFARPRPGARR